MSLSGLSDEPGAGADKEKRVFDTDGSHHTVEQMGQDYYKGERGNKPYGLVRCYVCMCCRICTTYRMKEPWPM